MSAGIILADKPGAWIQFQHRGRRLRARMDPLWLGPDNLASLLSRPKLVWKLLDERSAMRAMTSDPTGRRIPLLLEDYLDAVGLSFRRLGYLERALTRLDDLEVDLLRLGLDVRDWLDLEGELSSRRVALIVGDLLDRPDTRLGAHHYDVNPISKTGMVAAQIVEQNAGDKTFQHPFLRSPEDLELEAKQRAIDAEKRDRIKDIRPDVVEHQAPTVGSFSSAQDESKKALAEILAGQNTNTD